MKKLLIFAVIALAALTASAQKQAAGTFSIMPRVGAGASIFSDVIVGTQQGSQIVNEEASSNLSYAVGAELKYQVSELFGVAAGVNFDYYMSSDKKINGIDMTTKLGFIDIPVLAQFSFGEHFGIEAGVQPGFKVSAKCGDNDLEGTNSFQLSLPVGLTWTFNTPVVLGIRYNLPLTKLYDGDGTPKVSGVMLSLGYRFDL